MAPALSIDVSMGLATLSYLLPEFPGHIWTPLPQPPQPPRPCPTQSCLFRSAQGRFGVYVGE